MAGTYDVLSNAERIKRLQSVKAEVNQAIRACKFAQNFWTQSMANTDYVSWTTILSNIALKMASARTHATNADTELGQLATLDTVYPYFTFQYEWVVGRGGVNSLVATASGDTFAAKDVLDGNIAMPDTIITADSLIETGGFSNGANNGIFTILSITSTLITINADVLVNETCTDNGAYIRLIQLDVP